MLAAPKRLRHSFEHHGGATERNQERQQILRELISGDIQEAKPGGD